MVSIRRAGEYGILVFSTILAFVILSSVFRPGLPVNIDQPCHFARIWCLVNHDASVPNSWCNLQAGFPGSQYYYPPIDFIGYLLSLVFGLTVGYKLLMALTLFVPAIGAYVLLKMRGNTIGAAAAYAMILLQPGSWHIGGFEENILTGLWPYALSAGFWLLAVAFFINFLENQDYRSMAWAVVSTVFLTHPTTLIFVFFSFGFLAIMYRKKVLANYKLMLIFVGLAFLINAYYLLPLLAKASYFFDVQGGGIDWALFYGYLLSRINWYITLMAALGLVGLAVMDRDNRPILYVCMFIVGYTFLHFARSLAGLYFIGIRVEIYMAFAIFILAGMFLELLSRIKTEQKHLLLYASLIIIFLVTIGLFTRTKQLSNAVLLMTDPPQAYQYLQSAPEGRILVEETLYNAGQSALTFTHFHCIMPAYVEKDVIGAMATIHFPTTKKSGGDLIGNDRGNLFQRPLGDYSEDEIDMIIEDYNIKYVLAHSQAYIDYFSARNYSSRDFPPFKVFDTGIESSYFISHDGRILRSRFTNRFGSATVEMESEGIVKMSQSDYTNWRVKVDGREVRKADCGSLLCVQVPAGQHEVEFYYSGLAVEYVGYLLSIGALVMIVLIFKGVVHEKKRK